MTTAEFGKKIKEKYPQYKDIADDELGQKMIAKYPQYNDMVTSEQKPNVVMDFVNKAKELAGKSWQELTSRKFGDSTLMGPDYQARDFIGDVTKGAVTGLAKTTQNISNALPQADLPEWMKYVPGPNLAYLALDRGEINPSAEAVKATPQLQPTPGSTVSPIVQGMAEYAAPVALTNAGLGALGAVPNAVLSPTITQGAIAKGATFLAENIIPTQLIYQPDDQTKTTLNDRLQAAASDIFFSVGTNLLFKGVARVFRPMENASKVAQDGLLGQVDESAKAFPNMQVAAENTGIKNSEIISILKGETPMDDRFRNFVRNTENVSDYVRERAAKYPDEMFTTVDNPVGDTIIGNVPQIANVTTPTYETVKSQLDQFAEKMAFGYEPDFKQQQQLGILMRNFESLGKGEVPQKLFNYTTKMIDYMRSANDHNAAVLLADMKRQIIDVSKQIDLPNLARYKGKITVAEKLYPNETQKVLSATLGERWQDFTLSAMEAGLVKDESGMVQFIKDFPTRKDIVVPKFTTPMPQLEVSLPRQKETFNPAVQVIRSTPVEQGVSPEVARVAMGKTVAESMPNDTSLVEQIEMKPNTMEGEPVQDSLFNRFVRFPQSLTDTIKSPLSKMAVETPFASQAIKIANRYGDLGKEFVMRGRHQYEKTMWALGEFRKANKDIGVNAMSDTDWITVRNAVEGKEAAQTPELVAAVAKFKTMFDQWGDMTNVQKIQNYWPRRLNDEGKKWLSTMGENNDFVAKFMEANDIKSRAQALEIIHDAPFKPFFERERVMPDIPEKFRATPKEELMQWQNGSAKLYGDNEAWGYKQEMKTSLENAILLQEKAKGSHNETFIANELRDYKDVLDGKPIHPTTWFKPVGSALNQLFFALKMTPMTSIANSMQGAINSWLDGGVASLAKTMLRDDLGDKVAREMALNLSGSARLDGSESGVFGKLYAKAIGLEQTEHLNYEVAAKNSYVTIKDAWEKALKNPRDQSARKVFFDHAMFIDSDKYARSVASGKLPMDELYVGMAEGTRRKIFFSAPGERPKWTTSDWGRTAYIFHNYAISQTQLLWNAPLHRQIGYLFVIAPVLGIPMYALRAMMSNKPLPSDFKTWYAKGLYEGQAVGTPLDFTYAMSSKRGAFDYFAGGYTPYINVALAKDKAKQAQKEFTPNVLKRYFPQEGQ